jgi:benzoyl-CoA reductase/2-hydroxyglutaryl-CoA dehydratase subunit BcrC/BadD/HgdB
LPIHYPRPLLRAYGFHHIELWGPPGVDPALGNRHLQAYSCAIVRHATAFIQGKASKEIDLIFVPHTCDSLQGMASVFKDFIRPNQPVLTLYHPRNRSEAAVDFLSLELQRIATSLSEITGRKCSEDALWHEITIEEDALKLFNHLCLNRPLYAIDDPEFYRLLRSWEYLPPPLFIECAQHAQTYLESKPTTTAHVNLMLSGIVPEPMSLFRELNDMGAKIVADDLACCSRRCYKIFSDERDPYRRMAKMLMSMPPEPTVSSPIADRVAYLQQRARESQADGLLIYDIKFCEPELFDIPLLREQLAASGLPLLHIEVELSRSFAQQTLTRIEAFVETLAARGVK